MKDSLGNELKPGDWIKASDKSVEDAFSKKYLLELQLVQPWALYPFTDTRGISWAFAVKVTGGGLESQKPALEPWMPKDSKDRSRWLKTLKEIERSILTDFDWHRSDEGTTHWKEVNDSLVKLIEKLEAAS